jgi:predicted RNase H-like HicB family nuclease
LAIHEEVLATARRICRERGEETFRVSDIVHALPHLNPSSVRTHIVSRCCVNAPRNHPHKWDYFRRTGRGEYVILSPYDVKKELPSRVAESPSTYAPAGPARDTIHVVVRRSAGFYVAESLELALVTQGRSLDELLRNLRQAVRLHLEGEDPGELGLTASPRIVVTYEESLSGDGEA